MDQSLKNETFDLLYDYSIFRLHNSALKESRLTGISLPNPGPLSKMMRYLCHRFSGSVTVWSQLTNQKDFSIASYENFRTCVHSAFEDCNINLKFIYAYFEFVSICCISAMSTCIYSANVKEICMYSAEYMCNSTKFLNFLFQNHGWEGLLTVEYNKCKSLQEDTFKQWLLVLNNDHECL